MRARARRAPRQLAADQGQGRGSARPARSRTYLEEKSRSVATGRSIEEIAAGKGARSGCGIPTAPNGAQGAATEDNDGVQTEDPANRRHATREPRPRSKAKTKATRGGTSQSRTEKPSADEQKPKPQLSSQIASRCRNSFRSVSPRSTTSAPSGPDWLHEIKFDGYRIEARLEDGEVQLLTRKQQNWTHRFPPVAEAVAALPAATALLDGEIVVEDEQRHQQFFVVADRSEGRPHRPLRLLCFRSVCISTAAI